ncbi:MAG: phage tail tip lysozyme [Clostridia bacterium]|nr:phage tail tip lysozyme [Clostridia bacterium]
MTLSKKLKRVFTAFLAAVMMLTVIPFTASASTADIDTIFKYLVNDMGLTPAAACGVLANIQYESDFNYNLVGDNGTSYGICQWHNERLTNMKNYCAKNGFDWKSLEGQLNFLKYELATNKSDTGYIIDKLKNVSNNADGAYKAGYDWCYYFERPANKTTKSENRGTRARDYYWPKYSNFAPTVSAPSVSIGDVNNDGKINSSDALLVVQSSVGLKTLTSAQFKAADVDKNGKVTSADSLIILNISTGNESIKSYM